MHLTTGFLIYHSAAYTVANTFAILEHLITRYVFDFNYKHENYLAVPSFVVTLLATAMRLLAFYTAKQNFTHIISTSKKQNHRLVTEGIYKYLRHPSYTGFFYFSVASMLLISNYVSAVFFTLSLTVFFMERIAYEEAYLIDFFGDEYEEYRKHTYVFIPKPPAAFLKLIKGK